jgi:hypothetical protein
MSEETKPTSEKPPERPPIRIPVDTVMSINNREQLHNADLAALSARDATKAPAEPPSPPPKEQRDE